jgi:hypothetical protein
MINDGWDGFLISKYGYVPQSICYKCLNSEYEAWQQNKNQIFKEEYEACLNCEDGHDHSEEH